jgi:hypothetical protein
MEFETDVCVEGSLVRDLYAWPIFGEGDLQDGLEGMGIRDGLSLTFMLAEPYLQAKREGPDLRRDPLS